MYNISQELRKYPNLVKGVIHYLGRAHRIEILLFLSENEVTTWKMVKQAFGKKINDGTFRTSCVQLCQLGLAEAIPIDLVKNKWRLTDTGCLIADIVKRAVRDIEILCNPEQFIGRR